jgi:ATP-binding protein involved in chromosome partitioning
MKTLQLLLHEVEWGGLDVLDLDLRSGTGDVQLTNVQRLVVDGELDTAVGWKLSTAGRSLCPRRKTLH